MYDGFISYSHAADDLLAPRLQAGLQRFAKPWWKRRAVRIFRDETSLSANPHLWSSITEALEDSEWFVLLLSPDAAQSPWVNQEIEYWKVHKDPSRILPVLTDGAFEWSGTDVSGNAVPEQLRGVFSEEPRWVDLRFAKEETDLDLKDPRFADAVADISSAIRGIPKDELASEEVKQHRRTIRTAWAAGIGLLALSVFSVIVALFALDQRAEAEHQAVVARENEAIAQQSEATALAQAANSEARRLLGSATAVLDEDVQLSMLLLLEAYRVVADVEVREEVVDALQHASGENRLLARFPAPSGPVADWVPTDKFWGSYSNRGALSPDGLTIYHASRVSNTLVAIDSETGDQRWAYPVPEPVHTLDSVSVSPDGKLVALAVIAPVGERGRIVILDSATGGEKWELLSEGCPALLQPGGFSPDGRWFSALDGDAGCVDPGRPSESDWAVVYRTSTWEPETPISQPGATYERVQIAQKRAMLAFTDADGDGQGHALLMTFPGLDPIGVVESADFLFPAMAPSGHSITSARRVPDPRKPDLALLQAQLWRTESDFEVPANLGRLFDFYQGYRTVEGLEMEWIGSPFVFARDSSLLAVANIDGPTTDGRDFILDTTTGLIELSLYHNGDTFDVSWSADGSKLLTTHHDELLLWSVKPDNSKWAAAVQSGEVVRYAQQALVRGFTDSECAQYLIEPCPTLDEMRSG